VARRVWIGYKTGFCMQPGDSGGSVYTVGGDGKVAAKGIISGAGGRGGADSWAGAGEMPCLNIFTDIRDAYYALPGSLRTG
jgi:hypothetical protein